MNESVVVFVSEYPRGREYKLAAGLQQQGWTVILLCTNPPIFNDFKYFHTIINISSYGPERLAALLDDVSPSICHIFTYYRYNTAAFLLSAQRRYAVVLDPYDLLSGMFTEAYFVKNRWQQQQMLMEQRCLKLADGICCRHLETQVFARDVLPRKQNRVLVLDGCMPVERVMRGPEELRDIKVVYSGQVSVEKLNPAHNEGLLWMAKRLLACGLGFHVYPNAYSFADPDARFSEYRELEQTSHGAFQLHCPVSFETLARELSQYDIGTLSMSPVKGEPAYLRTAAKMKYCTTNKIFDYLDAGLPVITNDSAKFITSCLKRHGAAIMPDKLLFASHPDFAREEFYRAVRGVAAAQKSFHYTRQAAVLDQFYRKILCVKQGARVSENFVMDARAEVDIRVQRYQTLLQQKKLLFELAAGAGRRDCSDGQGNPGMVSPRNKGDVDDVVENLAALHGLASTFKFEKHIKPTDSAVDFCCGEGHLLQNLHCAHRTGIEEDAAARRSEPKFLQIHTFYPDYLDRFYRQDPGCDNLTFQEQINALVRDGFSGSHMIAPYMNEQGYESHLVIANCIPAQKAWLHEQGATLTKQDNWLYEIAARQVDSIKPDILYLSDPTVFDSRFVRSLTWKPKLILGWRAAVIPDGTDWSEFDVILSGLSALRDFALKLGARHTERFFPGYPSWTNIAIGAVDQAYDVVFSGQWNSGLHGRRNAYLRSIVEASQRQGFTTGLYLASGEQLPSEVSCRNLGDRFGLEMHRALMSGRIVFDARATHLARDPHSGAIFDLCGNETANMRIIEATGCGRMLLTEHFTNLSDYFEIGREIETFASEEELLEKICYYLSHPLEREEVARRGQVRCLRDYSMEKKAEEFHSIIRKYLGQPVSKPTFRTAVVVLKQQAERALAENHIEEAFQLLCQAKALKEPCQNIDLLRSDCFLKMQMPDAAVQALLEELRYFPGNTLARERLEPLQARLGCHQDGTIEDREFQMILSKIRPFTMLGEARLYNLYRLARYVCENDIPGNFVECGVAAGGSSALLAYVIKHYSRESRKIFSFDSFEGMPKPSTHDAISGVDAESTGWGTGTCAAPEASLQEVSEKIGVWHLVNPVKGYFENSLEPMRETINQIAFMHMDADWYESIKTILENFYDLLTENALVQLDDYGYWDGCSKALHEFEAKRNLKFTLTPIDGTAIWFQKPIPSQRTSQTYIADNLQTLHYTSNNFAKNSFKIVHLCAFASGGAGKAAYRLHHGLCEAGIQSEFLCLSKVIPDPTVKVIQGTTTSTEPGYAKVMDGISSHWHRITLDHPQRPAGLEMFSDADSPVRLASLEEIKSADVVHLHWIAGLVDYDELSSVLRGKKIIWTLHDMNPFTGGCHYAGACVKYRESCGACPQLGSSLDNDLSRKIFEKKRRGLQGVDITVVAPSRWLASCAAQSAIFKGYRVVCIPYGVPTDVFQPIEGVDVRKTLGISPDAFVILFGADNLENQRKGFVYLLEALRRYRTNKEVVLAVFGALTPGIVIDSPYRLVKLGAIQEEANLACIYSMADLLVIPSLEDNLPNTVLESMACGTPVVGFAVGGIPDMIEHKKTGYLAECGDIDGLVSGIDWLLTNPDKSLLRENCRRKVEMCYSSFTQVARFRTFYNSISRMHD